MQPFFSIIIPTFQRYRELKLSLQSVLNQTCTDYEILVMDDGSTDETGKLVKSFKDKRIFYHWQTNSGGPASPRNRGIKFAKGKWIAFLDSDDTWKKNKLEEVKKYINSNKDVDLIYHDFTIIHLDNFQKIKIVKSLSLNSPIGIDLLLRGNVIGLSTVVVRKELLAKVDGFNENKDMIGCEDYNAWLKISRFTENFFYLQKNLGNYTIHKKRLSVQDMTLPRSSAIKDHLFLLNNKQKIYLKSKFNYESGCFDYSQKKFEKSISKFLLAFKDGSYLIKVKSIVKIFQICIKKLFN